MLLRRFKIAMRCSRQCEFKDVACASEMRLRLVEKDAEKHAGKTGHVTAVAFDSYDRNVRGTVTFSAVQARPHNMQFVSIYAVAAC